MDCVYCRGTDPKKCKIKSELDILGDKWTLVILRLFFISQDQTYSFNELKKELKTITSKVLSEKLKKLVDCGYLEKKDINEKKKKRTIYSSLEKVRKLKNIISQFSEL